MLSTQPESNQPGQLGLHCMYVSVCMYVSSVCMYVSILSAPAGVVGWCDGPGYTSSAGVSYSLDKVGQGPTALAVGAGGVVWTFYSPLSFLSSFSLSLGDGLILTEIMSQRAAKPETINQSIKCTGDTCLRKAVKAIVKHFKATDR